MFKTVWKTLVVIHTVTGLIIAAADLYKRALARQNPVTTLQNSQKQVRTDPRTMKNR